MTTLLNAGRTAQHPDLIWGTQLDERFTAEVWRSARYSGELCIFDRTKNFKKVASMVVSLSYGAMLETDVGDILSWERTSEDFLDRAYNPQK